MIKLTREQTEEAVRNPDGVECQGEGTDKTFILVDAEIMQRFRKLLYQRDVNASIAEGISQMEAGGMMSLGEADDLVRSKAGLPAREG